MKYVKFIILALFFIPSFSSADVLYSQIIWQNYGNTLNTFSGSLFSYDVNCSEINTNNVESISIAVAMSGGTGPQPNTSITFGGVGYSGPPLTSGFITFTDDFGECTSGAKTITASWSGNTGNYNVGLLGTDLDLVPFASCIGGRCGVIDDIYLIINGIPVPPPPPFEELIRNATSTFNQTVGFPPSEAVQWSGDNLIKPIMGGGFSILYVIRFWIIAVVVIYIILFFAFKAFRFYKGPSTSKKTAPEKKVKGKISPKKNRSNRGKKRG